MSEGALSPRRSDYDRELLAALDELGGGPPPLSSQDGIAARRLHAGAFPPIAERLRERPVRLSDHTAPGGVRLSVLAPARARGTALPAVYFIHGGGMIAGDRFGGIDQLLEWVERGDVVAVTVEYRLAPEHPDPAPASDCYQGFVWTARHAERLGIDPGRILLWGVSAGGGLAAGVALMSRDRSGPAAAGQLLDCPMLDDRGDRPSMRRFADAPVWPRVSNDTAWGALLGARRGTDDVSPYAAPGRATELHGLPPAFVSVGSAEIFRDEAIAYAQSLSAAGCAVELHVWSGGFHNFERYAPTSRPARAARTARESWVGRLLGLP